MQIYCSPAMAWFLSIAQVLSPLLVSFTPAVAVAISFKFSVPSPVTNTVPYRLKKEETVSVIAKRHNLTVEELQAINHSRKLTVEFTELAQGDELDVPHSLPSGGAASEDGQLNLDVMARHVNSVGALLQNENTGESAYNMARSAILGQGNLSTEQWMSKYGTARAQVNVNDKAELSGSELDWLVPFHDDSNNLLFTQVGILNQDGRTTTNLGIGVRKTMGEWLYGGNAFYDYDRTGENRRGGLGAEAWTDYRKLSANGYFGITDRHQSLDFDDYDERPANGFDIRGEAFLPSHPQLGGKLKYEQYFGDEVALFGKDDRKKDPKTLTVGMNYTLFPLVTFGVEHRTGSGGNNDSSANLQFTFRPGESWKSHIDPASVSASRTLVW